MNAGRMWKTLISIEDDTAVVDGEEVKNMQNLGREELLVKCEKLVADLGAKDEECRQLLEETQELRAEYEQHKEKSKKVIQQHERAAKESMEPEERTQLRELEAQITTLTETNKTYKKNAETLEKRADAAEAARQRAESDRAQELDAWSKTMQTWKDRAQADRQTAEDELSQLRDQVASLKRHNHELEKTPKEQQLQESPSQSHPVDAATAEEVQALEAEVARLQGDLKRVREQASRDLEDANWEGLQATSRLNEVKALNEQLQAQLATFETKATRLETELEGKGREMTELLRKQEESLKTEISILKSGNLSLQNQLQDAHTLMAEMGESRAKDVQASGGQQTALQQQLDTALERLSEAMELHSAASFDAKDAADRLRAAESELQELRTENHRKTELLRTLSKEDVETREQVSALEAQSIEAIKALKAREDELEVIESQRQGLIQQAEAAEQTAAAKAREAQQHQQEAASAQQAERRAAQELDRLAYELRKATEKADSMDEERRSFEAIQANRNDEVKALKQRLAEKDQRIEEVLKLKDGLSAKARHLEKVVRERAPEGEDAGRRLKGAVSRSKSVVVERGRVTPPPSDLKDLQPPPPQPQQPAASPLFNWNRSKAVVLLIIAFIWIIGMYHNYTSTAAASPGQFEANTHLKAMLESQERTLLNCRNKLAAMK